MCEASTCSMERPYSTSSRTYRAFRRRRCAEAGWQRPSHAAESRKKPQVPPLRYAPVGMTISWNTENGSSNRMSSRAKRSERRDAVSAQPHLDAVCATAGPWLTTATVHPCRFTAQPLRILEFPPDALLRFVCMHCTAGDARLFSGGNIEFPTRSKRDRQSLVGVLSHSRVVQLLNGPGSVCPGGFDSYSSAREMFVRVEYRRMIAGQRLHAQSASQAILRLKFPFRAGG